MRPYFLTVFALVLVAGAPAAAFKVDSVPLVITKVALGCKDLSLYENIEMHAVAKSVSAYATLVADGIKSGKCRFWKVGDRVVLKELFQIYECLAPAGPHEGCYWTIMNAGEPIDE